MLDTFFITVNQWMTGSLALAGLGCFTWGLISVLFSPCHLASIPLIVAYVGGQKKLLAPREACLYSLVFTLGLFITIAVIGILCALLGRMLGDVGNYWQILVGLILIWVSLGMLGVESCSLSGRLLYKIKLTGIMGAFVLGLAYGILSGSCTFGFIAPILAIITVQEKIATCILFILLFGMGHCLPLVIAGSSMASVKKLLENYSWNTAGSWFRKMAGSFIFLLGIYFVLAPFTTHLAFGASAPKNILIISIDALHPKALGPKSSPLLDTIMKQGVYTLAGQSTSPPLTLISHAAMFSGLPPEQNGKTDNDWQPGQPTIENQTLFHSPKRAGFSTGYFYSKEKLGFLINEDIDSHGMSKEFALEQAIDFFQSSESHFCFLHLSGLDQVGPSEGWLSLGYLEELFFIDTSLEPLFTMIQDKKNYLIIITSDHAGHGKIHGSDHPEDSRIPLIMISDIYDLAPYQNLPYQKSQYPKSQYQVTQLKGILDTLLMGHTTLF